jgi:citrate lyase subunit beta/citryl-CoA lyase
MIRSRRSCLAVPGSNPRMIEKSRGIEVDYVFLDLEDAVAPGAKVAARSAVADAVAAGGWNAKTVAVRVNDLSTPYTYRDVIEVVETAGPQLDVIVLPKVQWPEQVAWLDILLGQVERTMGFPEGGVAIEAMVESGLGLTQALAIAQASDRVEALVFGPGDYAADTGLRSAFVGAEPFEGALDFALHTIRVAATAAGVQAVDGPWQHLDDPDGLRRKAARSAALGFDGTWVIHPSQVEVANEVFTPSQESYDRAERVLDAVEQHAATGVGAARLDGEMIDEASRKLALSAAVKGRAAGLARGGSHAPAVATDQ